MKVAARLTKNQSLVLGALTQAREPLSAYAILDRLRDDGVRAPLQVYRALDRLLELHLVHRLDSLKAFVACSQPHSHDHEHAHGAEMLAFGICERCAKVWEFSDAIVCERIAARAAAEGFRPTRTSIEISGLCTDCAKAA